MINENMKDLPKFTIGEKLIDYTETLTDWYNGRTTPEYRKKRGQFFTPKATSEFMVRQFLDLDKKESIRILDPGAGIGIFESAICELLISKKKKQKFSFDLYENDENILPLLENNMIVCKEFMTKKGYDISYQIHDTDFILSNSHISNDELNDFELKRSGYDFVISNPPFYKLKKGYLQAIEISSILRGYPNIYTLFMALSAKLLRNGGQITVLTPRSYCSGLYFKNFRKWFFKNIKPVKIHVFKSRKEVFKKYNVLQEMVILTGIKNNDQPKNIIISTSRGEPNKKDDLKVRRVGCKKIIIENNDDVVMRIPTSRLDESIAAQIDKFGFKLSTLGLKVSTGPVVPFRAVDYLLNDIKKGHNYAPLIWMHNIRNGKIKWPKRGNNKPIAIENKEESNKLLIANENYVLIKRFSTKEGKRRIYAGILLKRSLSSDYIGIENHVNYIHKIGGKLTEDESYGIAAILNSRLYNRYFKIINGSTQVNATEISNIPLPSLEKIRRIGSLVRKDKENNEIRNEKIIAKELSVNAKIIVDLIGGR